MPSDAKKRRDQKKKDAAKKRDQTKPQKALDGEGDSPGGDGVDALGGDGTGAAVNGVVINGTPNGGVSKAVKGTGRLACHHRKITFIGGRQLYNNDGPNS